MINRKKLIVAFLTAMFVLTLIFPLMGMAAAESGAQSPSRYDRIVDHIAKEKGISTEEAKSQFDAKLSKIAKKKGITLEELKQQIAEGKFHKGRKKPLDEAKLKEIAEKKGITVEELKQRMNKYHCNDAKTQ
ncbi:MAG: hypothetical protein AWM53_01416 [Candidatus Dichloromethanomonas elyunquensis]|nr:MAG: hypothetical protein AWM53_01416 [Candidatus Dichloromethanomonas elyunquensis]